MIFNQCEVTYSRKDIEQKINTNLRRLYASYVADSAQIQEKDFKLARAVRNILFQLSYCYKGEEFSEEEEIRLIIYPKAGFEEWTDGNGLRLYTNKDDGKLYLNISGWFCYCVTDKLEKCNSRALNSSVLSADEIRTALND